MGAGALNSKEVLDSLDYEKIISAFKEISLSDSEYELLLNAEPGPNDLIGGVNYTETLSSPIGVGDAVASGAFSHLTRKLFQDRRLVKQYRGIIPILDLAILLLDLNILTAPVEKWEYLLQKGILEYFLTNKIKLMAEVEGKDKKAEELLVSAIRVFKFPLIKKMVKSVAIPVEFGGVVCNGIVLSILIYNKPVIFV